MKTFKRAALAAVLTLGVLGAAASAAQAVTVTPAGQAFTMTSGSTTLTPANGPTVTCSNSVISGAVPTAPDNTGEVVTAPGLLEFNNCSSGIPFSSTTVTDCNVSVAISSTAPGGVNVSWPNNCIAIEVRLFGALVCTIDVDGNDVDGQWSNAGQSATIDRTTSNALPITTSGGGCAGVSGPAAWAASGGGDPVYTVSAGGPITVS